MLTEPLCRYLCKRFTNDKWIIIGTVYATDISEAWSKAKRLFGKVDNVWEYNDSITWIA